LLRQLSIYSGILPIIFFFLFLLRNKKEGLWVIFLYVVTSFLTDFSFLIFNPPAKLSFYFFSLFTILEYSFFTGFIYVNLRKKTFKQVLLATSLLFYLFCTVSLFSAKGYYFDSLPASIESIVIIIFCIFYFFEQINKPDISFIYSSKKFWIVTAFLVYLSGTLFLFIYTSNLSETEQTFYWPINFIFNILKNVLITLAFFLPASGSQSFMDDNFLGKPPLTHFKH
jgi:hypothetical protein